MAAHLTVCLHRGSGIVSRLIQWQTRSPYSHASLMLRSGMGVESREGHGVRWVNDWRNLRAAGDAVDMFTIRLTDRQAQAVEVFALEQTGKSYDWTMVARFLTRRQASRTESGKWFCSELVFAAFQQAGVELLRDTQPWEVSPGLLARSPLLQLIHEEVPE